MEEEADSPSRGPFDVLHVTPRLGRCGGGVWQFVHDLALAQADLGQRVAIVGLDCPNLDEDARELRDDGRVHLEAAKEDRTPLPALGYSRDLGRRVDALAARSKLIHAHGGLRMWTLTPVRRAAKKHGLKILFAPHGGLYPWLLRRNRLKKELLYWTLDRRNLAAIDTIHATCEQELGFCRDYGLTQPAVVVPPGVRPLPSGDAERWLSNHPHHPALRGKRLCGFLGYFDRKKGLIRLVRAWAHAGEAAKDWHLVIAGHDQRGHAAEVEAEIARHGLGDQITLLGPQLGQAKSDFMAAIELFVLPTDWENFGVVIGEALAAGVPVLTTTNTPWEWLEPEGAGWHVPPTEPAITAALAEALAADPSTLAAKGRAGQRALREKNSWTSAATALTQADRERGKES